MTVKKAAILAAGLGERLRAAGFSQPKPLVPVAGRPLVDYALGAVSEAGIRDVACIVNEQSEGIEAHCRRRWPRLEFSFVRRTTPSSMESLFTLSPLLTGGRCLVLTVDSVFPPGVLSRFLADAEAQPEAHATLAVTRFVDDEKPLWARLDSAGRIVALGPAARDGGLVTAGFYIFDPVVFSEIAAAREAGFDALRRFLAHLLERGYRLFGARVPKTVDVDRAADVAVATAFVESGFAA